MIFAREIISRSEDEIVSAFSTLGDDLQNMIDSFDTAELDLAFFQEMLADAIERITIAAGKVGAAAPMESPDADADWVRAPSPVADSAEWSGYDFRSYDFDLRSDGSHIGRLRLGRDEAVKLALTILGVQTFPGCRLTSQEAEQVRRIAEGRIVAAD